MNLDWSEEDLAFRDEVREFFAAELPSELAAAGSLMTSVYADADASFAWQRILHKKGWVAPAWPIEHGGCGWIVTQRYIWACERIAAGAPPLSPMGLQMCGPALIGHGSPEQQAYFLPRMLNGEHFWCQGYSEVEAGSDLAALQMGADEDGDDLVCTGTKIWITHAHRANWMFCLVRTSQEDRPQNGITFLLIDMTTPGITVTPIVSPAGENIQNEVAFDRVRVPRTNVVGGIGKGWTVAKYLLEFERGGTAYAPELAARLEEIERLADGPVLKSRLAAARTRIMALELFELQIMARVSAGGSPGTSASMMKILGTELAQHLTELALEVAGPYALAYQPQAGRPGGPVHFAHGTDHVGTIAAALAPLRYFNQRAGTIYAGSNEIQRNILAKTALGF